MTGSRGMNSGRRRWSAVHTSSTTPTRMDASPTVIMNTEIGDSPSIGRIATRSTSAPSSAEARMAPPIAAHTGHCMSAANA
ncbi:Uncharacterised protein [Bordetella pertussis]|nr:Uncharacterised protein [Bordetella pertussis]CPQ35333.1 Uncharacterised protein [Bordetella pertussis]CPQ53228.1 Uncharacterised protein [Bordetella pertussis]CRE32173.1 Uncharacterised protein [Bordetella pertussis]